MHLTVIGAGIVGLACAVELAERGESVEVLEHGEQLGSSSCSWYAGGMLAPWCELESAEPPVGRLGSESLVARLGSESIAWWRNRFPGTAQNGSLVIAQGRDAGELARFARRTERFESLDGESIAALEPDLAGRFGRALFFRDEGHLDPRAALASLVRRLGELGVPIRFGVDGSSGTMTGRRVIDCRGLAARDVLTDLRGVKGEMVLLRCRDMSLSRPVRVLHPRVPVYIVPRHDGLFMVGATMIESDEPTRVSARSMLELLGAAYALHPAFGEAQIIEMGTGVRPAFPDNLPRIAIKDEKISVNGLYRHGFLLAPALAELTLGYVARGVIDNEVMQCV